MGTQLGFARTPNPQTDLAGQSGEIIGRYLQATSLGSDTIRSASMQVDINASVPKLRENGRLRALRFVSRVGRISYKVLGFQGSNTVKSQIIARYLEAEQQNQSNPKLAITPVNYRFRLKGTRLGNNGPSVYVFALSPRKSGQGLFKGEIWLDAESYLPVFEKGRLVKNPSVFFKKVDFERAFDVQSGRLVPAHMSSVITTRLVGKVELDVSYSNFSEQPDQGFSSTTAPVISPVVYQGR